MLEKLFQSINKISSLDKVDWEVLSEFIQLEEFRKNHTLLKIGDVCDKIYYIVSGILCSCVDNHKDEKKVIEFTFKEDWSLDLGSFIRCEPATTQIVTLTDAVLFSITKENHDLLIQKNDAYKNYYLKGLEKANSDLQFRIIQLIGNTAVERYETFLNFHEDAPLIKQQLIANYLGISPETLSRIKKQITK